MNYSYQLEKHPKKKGNCPSCEKKGTFRFMTDLESGNRLSNEFGRCDRESSCGYFKRPDSTGATSFEYIYKPSIKEPKTPQKFVDKKVLINSIQLFNKTELYMCLTSLLNEDKINKAIELYYLGGDYYGNVIFWSVNEKKQIINGKSIKYELNGKRDKSKYIRHLYSSENGYLQSLFGLHLIIDNTKPIAIVESEKTAVISSMFYPQYIWLASGSSNGLTLDKIKPLKNREITLIPDCDKAGREAFSKAFTRLSKSNKVKLIELDKSLNDGSDLADILLKT